MTAKGINKSFVATYMERTPIERSIRSSIQEHIVVITRTHMFLQRTVHNVTFKRNYSEQVGVISPTCSNLLLLCDRFVTCIRVPSVFPVKLFSIEKAMPLSHYFLISFLIGETRKYTKVRESDKCNIETFKNKNSMMI